MIGAHKAFVQFQTFGDGRHSDKLVIYKPVNVQSIRVNSVLHQPDWPLITMHDFNYPRDWKGKLETY